MSRPLVSVVITTYQRRTLLIETLSTVQAQSMRDIEILVVDDGSSPPTFTPEEAANLGIRYLHKPNGGQPAARNYGVSQARGEFLAFIDDDDLWHPEKLELQCEAIARTGAGWSYCECAYFEGSTDNVTRLHSQIAAPREGQVFDHLLRACFVASPTVVARRDLVSAVGGFNEDRSARYGEDWAMWMKLSSRATVAYVPRVLAYYRTHSGSMLRGSDLLQERESHLRNFDWVFSSVEGDFTALRAEAEFLDLLRMARVAWSRGDDTLARHFAGLGWQTRPCSTQAWATLLATRLPRRWIDLLRGVGGRRARPRAPSLPPAGREAGRIDGPIEAGRLRD